MANDRHGGTILVVDDNGDVRGLAKRVLEIAGYTVITAADGEEGLRSYEKHRSNIVLLLTDVVMPNIGGFELAERVLGMDSQVSVVLMSGNSACDYRSLEYLAKPFRPTELIETVSRVLSANAHSQKTVAYNA
jgi:two-component system, cell cycle sensor histidine kinase and response regulator CckA